MGKNDLKQLIAQARLNEAVDRLLEQIKAYSTTSKSDKSVGKLSDILIINSGKLHGLQHDKMLGILDRQNEQVTLAQVHQAILYVIDELPDEFWNASLRHQTVKLDNNNEAEPKTNSTFEKIDLTNLVGNDNISLQNITNSTVAINVNSSERKPQPSSSETHRSLEDPAVSLITIKTNRKKLIYLLSPLILIAVVVFIVYLFTKAYEPNKKPIIPQSVSNDSLSPQLVLVKGGEFMMGDDSSQYSEEKPAHKVVVSDFNIGKYEVTQKQWKDVMGTNPSSFNGCDNCPVEQVSWNDVQEYIKKLRQKTGKTYRLPTEAEWEYACRAGTITPFNTGNNLTTSQANYNGDLPYNNNPKGVVKGKTMPFGSFAPNAWGLCDMHGNVWEWCSDWYGNAYYQNSPQGNPIGPSFGFFRVVRGGSWLGSARYCRTANRHIFFPDKKLSDLGFRIVFVN